LEKVCVKCDADFTASGTGAHYRKYCEPCQEIRLVEIAAEKVVKDEATQRRREREPTKDWTPMDGLKDVGNRIYEGDCVKCGTHWMGKGTSGANRKFCYECKPLRDHGARQQRERPYCQLEGCQKQIPKSRGVNAKYCTEQHRKKSGKLRYAAKLQAKKDGENTVNMFRNPNTTSPVKQERQGHVMKVIKDDPIKLEMLLNGDITASALAIQLDVSVPAVTRAMHAILAEMAVENERAKWKQSSRVKAMLPKAKMDRARVLGLSGQTDTTEYTLLIEELVRAYSVFSRRYFNLEGKRPIIKEFHLRWIRSIIEAYATGGKQLILSPPRHGKSETLIRFVIWLVMMDPNIRIGWFCASRDIAELMLGSVKDILESDETLIRDVLPPGEIFDPGLKSNKPWSKKEIKVAQQTHIGAKSSTMIAIGRTSKFLSRDMDLVIIDDLEDFDSTREEGQRLYSKNKLAEIGTRKVEETAEVYIGSRQHPDDIPNSILDLEDTILQWKIIVDSAHDEECGEDPDDLTVHTDCMLFPEVRSYRYLMEKKLEMETLGLGHMYPLRYLNNPIPEDGQVFDVKLIRDVGLNRERGLGLEGLPLGWLVGGLDPSARGIQASYLWHYRAADTPQKVKLSMVDIDTLQSGGSQGALKIIREWYHTYGLELWYFETNSTQVDWFDTIKRELRTRPCHICEETHPEIVIKDHNTGKNKKDAELGISSMAPLFHSGSVDLPFGTNEARRKTNMLLRQLELWTTDGVVRKKAKTDIKMAMWFPWAGKIQSFTKEQRATQVEVAVESSYPMFGDVGGHAPWGVTDANVYGLGS